MLHPSRCCAKGLHIESAIAPGVFKCIWCGKLRLQQSSVGEQSSKPLGATVVDSAQPTGDCCGDSRTRQVNYPRPTITEVYTDERT